MQLFTIIDDYCVKKITAVCSFAKLSVDVEECDEATLKDLCIHAHGMVLQTVSGGAISQQNAILRYLGNIAALDLGMSGVSSLEIAQVDQWLSTVWADVEVPLQMLMALSSSTPQYQVTPEEKLAMDSQIKADISKSLDMLEKHLSGKNFFVGARLTIVDVAFYCVFNEIVKHNVVKPSAALSAWGVAICKHLAGDASAFPAPAVASLATSSFTQGNNGSAIVCTQGTTQGCWNRRRIRVKELLAKGQTIAGENIILKGWIRTCRSAEKGKVFFIELTDGSTVKSVQLVLNQDSSEGMEAAVNCGGVGGSVSVNGVVAISPSKGQAIEIQVVKIEVLGQVFGGVDGTVGGKNYPMAKKAHSLEFLREKAHLRIRSKVFSSAMRMRHAMAFATHKFFNDLGFVYTHTPLITAADCEGAGEQFCVTSLLPEKAKMAEVPTTKEGNVDFSKDFFGRRCCMTVSGQLNVETHAAGLSDVYTFGPSFRAENSHTSRHLAEFWMIEPEICFASLEDNMALAEDYVRFCTKYALENCADDLHYFENEYPMGEKGLKDRLQNVVDHEFARITYTDAIDLLQREIAAKRVKFEKYPRWGDDLGSEHERFMCEKIYAKPTIVTDYPKDIKAFYMKLNEDDKTVMAMDILVPKIGELVGGSAREDRVDVLEARCVASGMKASDIWWYADLRRYGTVPHAGFGLGFERLIMFVTGLENIRDVIPFPRVPGHAEF